MPLFTVKLNLIRNCDSPSPKPSHQKRETNKSILNHLSMQEIFFVQERTPKTNRFNPTQSKSGASTDKNKITMKWWEMKPVLHEIDMAKSKPKRILDGESNTRPKTILIQNSQTIEKRESVVREREKLEVEKVRPRARWRNRLVRSFASSVLSEFPSTSISGSSIQ